MTPGDALDGTSSRRVDRTLVVERTAERVDHAADERGTDGYLDDPTGRLDLVAFLDLLEVAQDDGADRLLFQVEGHAVDAAGELEELRRQRALEAVHLRDAVTDLDHGADGAHLHACVELVDCRLDDRRDLVSLDSHQLTPQ